ncbi:MAG: hypothetical protein L3J44_06650 [Campylobacteraceae bacterium]|nr:hypothetical protein [Campylobacteraceae bacterium]
MMEIFGHDFIQNSQFFFISKIEDIKKTSPNCVVFFDFDKEIIAYCKSQGILFGVKVRSITELILASASNAKFLLVDKNFAKDAQKIANEYMFDAKILLLSKNEEDIEFCAKNGIDGIIFDEH